MGDAHTLAELKAINNALSGTLSLNDYTVDLTGSAADLAAALAGSFASTYTGNVTINDANSASIAAIRYIYHCWDYQWNSHSIK